MAKEFIAETRKGSVTPGDDVEDAAADIIEAVHDKDPMALALALRRSYLACKAEHDGDSSMPSSEGEEDEETYGG